MQWQFYRHMPVYLADGRKLGRLEEVGHGLDFLHVQQGLWLVRDWYVPVSAIAEVNDRGVTLTADAAEAGRQQWQVPPVQYLLQQGATRGYDYTSPADVPRYQQARTAASGETES